MPVTTQDYVAVQDHMGRYCHAVDEGRADDWAQMFTHDGIFAGFSPEPLIGHEALKAIPTNAHRDSQGTMCHIVANLYCDYGDTADTILASLYNYVSTWMAGQGGRSFAMAKCKLVLVRNGDGWLIKSNHIQIMNGA
jgi:hypothetical protein